MPEPAGWPQAGDQILVDTNCYGVPGEHWCPVLLTVYKSASSYPIKVQVPGRGTGQYRLSEVKGLQVAMGGPDDA